MLLCKFFIPQLCIFIHSSSLKTFFSSNFSVSLNAPHPFLPTGQCRLSSSHLFSCPSPLFSSNIKYFSLYFLPFSVNCTSPGMTPQNFRIKPWWYFSSSSLNFLLLFSCNWARHCGGMSFSIKEHKLLLLKRLLMIIYRLLNCKGQYRDPFKTDSFYTCPGLLPTVLPVHYSLVRLHTSLSLPILLPSPDFLFNAPFPWKSHPIYEIVLLLQRCISDTFSLMKPFLPFPWSLPLPTSPYCFVEYVLERVLWELYKSPSSKITFSEQSFIWYFNCNIISVLCTTYMNTCNSYAKYM